MKRKTAKEILSDSFRELAETKNIDKITVKDITDNCGYSTATFYRHFRDKYDLIAWEHTRGVAEIMDQIGDDYSWNQTLVDGAISFLEQREYLANLFLHTGGHDSFIRYMTDINFCALKKHILKNSGKSELDEKTEMYIRIYCLGTVNLTCEWILGKYKVTPEELAEIYEKSLPSPLYRYLYNK
jgi:AcrR family transcriptional regulator